MVLIILMLLLIIGTGAFFFMPMFAPKQFGSQFHMLEHRYGLTPKLYANHVRVTRGRSSVTVDGTVCTVCGHVDWSRIRDDEHVTDTSSQTLNGVRLWIE